MNTGMDTDIDNTNDVKKTATTNDELLRLKVDTSSGTHLSGQDSIREEDFNFF